MIAGFLVVVVIAAAAVFVLFMDKWGGSFDKMITYVSKAGGMYHSVYADLIYFIPAAFIVLFYLLKKKKYPRRPCDGTFYGGMHLCDVRISDKSHDVILLLF